MSFVCTVAARLPDTCPRSLLTLPRPRPVGSPNVQRHPDEGGVQPLGRGLHRQPHHGADAHRPGHELGTGRLVPGPSEAWRLKRRLRSQSPATRRAWPPGTSLREPQPPPRPLAQVDASSRSIPPACPPRWSPQQPEPQPPRAQSAGAPGDHGQGRGSRDRPALPFTLF